MDKKLIIRIALAAWVIIWAIFLIRPFFKKDLLKEYSVLLRLPSEGKRAYILGDDLHRLLSFCSHSINGPFSYRIIGLDEDSIEYRRAKYYLYPSVIDKEPDFILAYKTSDLSQRGYKVFKSLSPEMFILEKVK